MKNITKLKIGVRNDFKNWLEETYQQLLIFHYMPRPRIECEDGFHMSVQGGDYTYSHPRKNGFRFESMEIGFPSEYEELIRDYAESNDFTDTVYPYVPIDVIIEVIKKHGGFKKNIEKV